MKRTFLLLCIIASVLIYAEPWHNELNAGLNLSFNNYSDNWAGEEVSNMVWSISANGLAEKQLSSMFHIKNTMKLSFGQTSNRDTSGWSDPLKSSDVIEMESILRATMGWFADPFAGLRIESQFLDSRDTTEAAYINPSRISESFGLARMLYKTEKTEISMRFGGTVRQGIDYMAVDSSGNRAVELINDGGLELTADCNTPMLSDRVSYTGKLTLYKALFNSNADALAGTPAENNWKAIDVYLDNIFSAKITDYIDVRLNVQMLYDKEIDNGLRHKENLSLGVNYRFL